MAFEKKDQQGGSSDPSKTDDRCPQGVGDTSRFRGQSHVHLFCAFGVFASLTPTHGQVVCGVANTANPYCIGRTHSLLGNAHGDHWYFFLKIAWRPQSCLPAELHAGADTRTASAAHAQTEDAAQPGRNPPDVADANGTLAAVVTHLKGKCRRLAGSDGGRNLGQCISRALCGITPHAVIALLDLCVDVLAGLLRRLVDLRLGVAADGVDGALELGDVGGIAVGCACGNAGDLKRPVLDIYAR
jgi:hypothetical protein